MNTIDELIEFVAQTEWNVSKLDIANYGQVYEQIYSQLQALAKVAEQKNVELLPLIYHLDVSAMYPNIILTNRL